MRIIIEIDGREAAAASVQPQTAATAIPEAPAMPSGLFAPSVTAGPLPGVGIGAIDAGPAPSAMEAPALTAVPSALTAPAGMTMTSGMLSTAAALGMGAEDAGPAPTDVAAAQAPMALSSQSAGGVPTPTFFGEAAGMARVTVADTP